MNHPKNSSKSVVLKSRAILMMSMTATRRTIIVLRWRKTDFNVVGGTWHLEMLDFGMKSL